MITVQELRIGNRLRPCRVVNPALQIMGYTICARHIAYSDEELNRDWEPIGLTPEILEKCGFQYGETVAKCNSDDKNSQAWSRQISNSDWLEFQMVKGVQAPTMQPTEWPEWRIVNEFSWIRQDFWGQPKYLHQLQNLFYALSGEELNCRL